ncbi:MAG: tetratricopeptide (TPR) repeat protein [Gammaproteobacteria bacterium]
MDRCERLYFTSLRRACPAFFHAKCSFNLATRRRKSASRARRGPPALPAKARSLVENAVRRHHNGELLQAEHMYREAARHAPGHPDIHHLLGAVLHQQNRNAEARVEVEAAIQALEHMPHYHNTLGEVLRAMGDSGAAIGSYRRAIELQPDNLQAINNLGLALHASGNLDAARNVLSQVVAAQPDVAQAHNNLGIAEQSLGNLEGAAQAFRRSCELLPQYVEGWNNLGTVLQELGRTDQAVDALERAIGIAPNLARAHFNLSRLRLVLDDVPAAEACVRRAIELEPRDAEYRVHLAYVLRFMERFDESLTVLRDALSRAPGDPVANNDIAVTLLMNGEFSQAEQHLLAAIQSAPDMGIAYENLSRARRFGPGDALFMQRLESRAQAAQAPQEQAHFNFALGKMWDDRGDEQRAFGHFHTANAATRRLVRWDADAHSQAVDQIITTFDGDWFSGERIQSGYGEPSHAPVLIIGMLRSGTSLIEQILASHSQVIARGELDFFTNVTQMMVQKLGAAQVPYPQCALQLQSADMRSIAQAYLQRYFGEPVSARHFTDKNPLNFEHLGLIAAIFPHAKFIHVRREPMDTCLSIYNTHFSRELGFAYDLHEIGRFYKDYERLMAHWQEHLGERLIEVSYESLVSEQERDTRALLSSLGLDWEAGCMDFHRTERMVGTASHWQVRQPLYTGAVRRWQRYAPWLGDLQAALAQ